MYGLALLHRHARRIKTQESRRVVVPNVALLFGTEESAELIPSIASLIASGQIFHR
jgi:hypothetical protein